MSFLIRFLLAVPLFSIQIFIMLFDYLKLIYTNLKWVLDFLVYHPFYKLREPRDRFHTIIEEEEEEVQIWHYHDAEEEDVDCAVCLCKIAEGEAVRVLRCEHVFHRDCLERWIRLKNPTCPLCRNFVGSGRRVIGEVGAEVLFFRFCPFGDSDERESWWLR